MTTTLPRKIQQAFGDEAQRYVARLPADVPVIASDHESAPSTLPAAADFRRNGTIFYAAPLIEDNRALVAQILSAQLLGHFSSIDDRRNAFDNLAHQALVINAVAQSTMRIANAAHIAVLRDLVIMSDAILARSYANLQTILTNCGYTRRFHVIAPGIDDSVPLVVPERRDTVVVWAPRLPAARLGVIAMGVSLLKSNVVFVCASGDLPDVHGSFVGPKEGAAYLARASCIIDASIGDPSTAIALARIGVPLVTASTTGAAEFLDQIFEYEPWNYRSINGAVSRARGSRPPLVRRPAISTDELRETLCRAQPPVVAEEPLVSIVLTTFNRPQMLEKVLGTIAVQTYRNLDIIVINDGGIDVADVCARFSFVRLVQLEKNVGPALAVYTGSQLIRGKYFGFWADDDFYFPDHFARLVDALESSGANVAHTNTLTRYYATRNNGTQRTRAYKILHEIPNDPVEMMTGPYMAFGLMLFRSVILDEIGHVDPECGLLDVEYQARTSQRYDFVAVDHVTGQWNYSIEKNTYTHEIGQATFIRNQEAIYAKYPSLLACVARRRADWLNVLAEKFDTVIWPPNVYLPDDFED